MSSPVEPGSGSTAGTYAPDPYSSGAYPAGAYPAGTYPAGTDAAGYSAPYGSHATGGAVADGSHPVGAGDGSSSRSLGELISQITTDLSTLMRQEVALAKAEATQSAKRVGKGAGMLGGAGFAGYFVLLFLSIALWWALGDAMGHGWSALIVAVIWAIVGAVLAIMGRKQLAEVRGLDRTTETLGKIPNAVKGNEEENR